MLRFHVPLSLYVRRPMLSLARIDRSRRLAKAHTIRVRRTRHRVRRTQIVCDLFSAPIRPTKAHTICVRLTRRRVRRTRLFYRVVLPRCASIHQRWIRWMIATMLETVGAPLYAVLRRHENA